MVQNLMGDHRPPTDDDVSLRVQRHEGRYRLKALLEEQYDIPCPPHESPEHWYPFLVMLDTDLLANDLGSAHGIWDRIKPSTEREDA